MSWLRDEAVWNLRIESFYEQHELSVLEAPGACAERLRSAEVVDNLTRRLASAFDVDGGLVLVDVSAHRLTPGQTIRIHND